MNIREAGRLYEEGMALLYIDGRWSQFHNELRMNGKLSNNDVLFIFFLFLSYLTCLQNRINFYF